MESPEFKFVPIASYFFIEHHKEEFPSTFFTLPPTLGIYAHG